ncbi:unnamed protein product [Paramecium primaurelia]|uniref:Uncharacterized protein n=1 Tax=Paramecium primaurelia TaxID=5886 RepID=A0A8S1K1G3_PARPR|nr:unnamed protein product [Paramecium primaurelia]
MRYYNNLSLYYLQVYIIYDSIFLYRLYRSFIQSLPLLFAWYQVAQQEIREKTLSACTQEEILVDKVKQLKKQSVFINEIERLRNSAVFRHIKLKILKYKELECNKLFLQSVSEQHFINLEDLYLKRWLTPEQILDNIFQDKLESYFTLPSFFDRSKELKRIAYDIDEKKIYYITQ